MEFQPSTFAPQGATAANAAYWADHWDAGLRILEQSAGVNAFKIWISALQCQGGAQRENSLCFQMTAPSDFHIFQINDRFRPQIEAALTQVTGTPCTIEITAAPQASQRSPVDLLNTRDFHSSVPAATPESVTPTYDLSSDPIRKPSARANLDPRFVFDNFIVGASNQLAHATAVAVAQRPGQQYNPLFIYSQPGLGKTHLLHAIGNYILAHNPTARVTYVTAEGFMNDLIESIQRKHTSQFREKYRNSCDVLLIDDVHSLAGKTQTEEEFFHTFNELQRQKKQIVLTSDRPPSEIEKLEERIRTRLVQGMLTDISAPEIETRIAILKAKAESSDIYLPDDVCMFLASHVKHSVRHLEGILIKLQAQASLTGAEISLEMAKQILKKAYPEENSELTIENIQEAVAKHFDLKVSDLKANTRAKAVAMPRQIAIYLIRKYTGMGFKEIGSLFGKDHSTVIHACSKVEREMDSEVAMRETIEQIQNLL